MLDNSRPLIPKDDGTGIQKDCHFHHQSESTKIPQFQMSGFEVVKSPKASILLTHMYINIHGILV